MARSNGKDMSRPRQGAKPQRVGHADLEGEVMTGRRLRFWGKGLKTLALADALPLLVLATALCLVPPAVAEPPPAAAEPPPAPSRLRTLEDAVAAGKLDAEVAESFARDGYADAMVTVQFEEALRGAEAVAPHGPDREGAMLETLRPAFAGRKARALGAQGSEAEVLEEYENLAVSFVRFRSAGKLL